MSCEDIVLDRKTWKEAIALLRTLLSQQIKKLLNFPFWLVQISYCVTVSLITFYQVQHYACLMIVLSLLHAGLSFPTCFASWNMLVVSKSWTLGRCWKCHFLQLYRWITFANILQTQILLLNCINKWQSIITQKELYNLDIRIKSY